MGNQPHPITLKLEELQEEEQVQKNIMRKRADPDRERSRLVSHTGLSPELLRPRLVLSMYISDGKPRKTDADVAAKGRRY